MTRKVLITLAGLLLICVPLSGTYAKEIKIGSIWGMTGAVSTIQCNALYGFSDYISYVNDHGGVKGHILKHTAFDSGYTVPGFLNQYWKLVEEGNVAIGCFDSQGGDAVKKQCKKDQIPIINSGMTENQMWPPGWIYGSNIAYGDLFSVALIWAFNNHKEKEPLRICWLTTNNPFGRAAVLKTQNLAKKIGVEMLGPVFIPKVPVDVTAELKVVEKYKPHYVFMNLSEALPATMANVQRLGLHNKMKFLNGVLVEQTFKIAAEASEKMLFAIPSGIWGDGSPGMSMIAEMAEKYRTPPQKKTLIKTLYTLGTGIAIITVGAIEKSLEKVSVDQLTGSDVKKYGLDQMKNYDMKGVMSNITFSPDDHRGIKYGRIFAGKSGGKLHPLTGYIPIPDYKHKQH